MTTREDLAPSRGTAYAAADGTTRRTFVRRHPRLAFAVVAIGATWAVQLTFLALGWSLFPAMLVELVTLAGTATAITRVTEGRAGVRRLYAGVLRWRFGVRWWAVVLTVVTGLDYVVRAVRLRRQPPETTSALGVHRG